MFGKTGLPVNNVAARLLRTLPAPRKPRFEPATANVQLSEVFCAIGAQA